MLTINCDVGDDALELLRGSHLLWYGSDNGMWLFRGQRDARWGLLPSAFRGVTLTEHLGDYAAEAEDDEEIRDGLQAHLVNEFMSLIEFMNLADDVGLVVPGDSPRVRSYRHRRAAMLKAIRDGAWPAEDMVPALALAQHHGVPTRLLDMTRTPLVGLYFAVLDCFQSGQWESEPDSQMAVWALDYESIALHLAPEEGQDEGLPTVELVTAARASNEFLAAQDGAFLLDRLATSRRQKLGRWVGLEEIIVEATGEAVVEVDVGNLEHHLSDADHSIVKIVVDADEAEALLESLAYERLTPAHLMPTYDNVVKSIKQYRRVDVDWLRQGGS